MDPTDQDETPKDPSASLDTKPEGHQEQQTVPLGELVKERQAKRAALDEAAALKAKIEAIEAKLTGTTPAPKANVDEELRADIERIKTRDRIRDLERELQLGDEKQAEEVAAFLDKAPTLTAHEALAILAKRDPEKFAAPSASQGRPAHGQLVPRPGSQPEPRDESDFQERLEFTANLAAKDKRAHRKYADNMVGAMMAEAMGWDHRKLPIPK